MRKFLVWCLGFVMGVMSVYGKEEVVYEVPIEGEINAAQLYILRRGLKQAQEEGVKTVVLRVNTPGGDLKTTLEMMEAVVRFKGDVVAYVDKEAISAGAYLSVVTKRIYMHPEGVIGSAAVVSGGGEDVAATMKQKVDSYMRAKVRGYTWGHRYRAEVMRGMLDSEYELVVEGVKLKGKGELLALTAGEASKKYGEPGEALLCDGVVEDMGGLLKLEKGEVECKVKRMELTWSEGLAKWLSGITPVILGVGLMLLFIEFKTPGFGWVGLTGIGLLVVVFLSSYVAGLAGYEPLLMFFLGVVLILVEVVFFPGLLVFGVVGALCLLGSFVWGLADTWPKEPLEFSWEVYWGPLVDVFWGLVIAVVGIVVLAKYFLKGMLWNRLVLHKAVRGISGERAEVGVVGQGGEVVVVLTPTGRVKVGERVYEAMSEEGYMEVGEEVEVVKVEAFQLIVRRKK